LISFDHCKQLGKIVDKIVSDGNEEIPFSCYPEIDDIDSNKICYVIDQFVIECPVTYEKYLDDLLKMYLIVQRKLKKYLDEFLNLDNDRINELYWTIRNTIDHLQFVLKIERNRFIDIMDRWVDAQSEIEEQPEKFEKLGPIEKILIIHYLKLTS